MLFVSLIAPVSAQEQVSGDFGLRIVYKDGEKVLVDDKENLTYIQAFLADGTPITLEEYKVELEKGRLFQSQNEPDFRFEKNNSKSREINPLNAVDMSYFTKTDSWSELMTPQKASATVDCRNSAQACPISSSTSITSTETWTAGLTAGDKSYVKASAGFQWASSSSSQLNYTLYVPNTKKGYLTFAPRYNFVKGDITYITCVPVTGCQTYGNKNGVWGGSPAKLSSGHADGVFALAYEN
ncbi:hypothetical protein ACFOQM_13700 [Paenibacillus sp. GCM10012307]|uniref:Uncharacterized protein n=1 Tax=Paenibacillus roseus TaxID=2798579 RepID=A0A934J5Z2_9BACL|nr:hypothetical protein [Paenibacillus roseus]MBJ6362344.1 hypothetical protein [Paenibacillus roseus]